MAVPAPAFVIAVTVVIVLEFPDESTHHDLAETSRSGAVITQLCATTLAVPPSPTVHCGVPPEEEATADTALAMFESSVNIEEENVVQAAVAGLVARVLVEKPELVS